MSKTKLQNLSAWINLNFEKDKLQTAKHLNIGFWNLFAI